MFITVEPRDGSELERLITALLNITGVVHQLIHDTDVSPEADGEAVMGILAKRIHGVLSAQAEFHDDDELAGVTGILALFTLQLAEELGLHGMYFVD